MSMVDKQAIIDDLIVLNDDSELRLEYIIKLGKDTPVLGVDKKNDQYKIEGCMSEMWLVPRIENNLVYFEVDSDALIPKGIAALLAKYYSGMTPEEIIKNPPDFLQEHGIEQHLSMNRRSGLSSLTRQIQLYAVAYQALATKS